MRTTEFAHLRVTNHLAEAAFALHAPIHLALNGHIHDAEHRTRALYERDIDCELTIPLQELFRAIEWVLFIGDIQTKTHTHTHIYTRRHRECVCVRESTHMTFARGQ